MNVGLIRAVGEREVPHVDKGGGLDPHHQRGRGESVKMGGELKPRHYAEKRRGA
jgi:hypothetical protein